MARRRIEVLAIAFALGCGGASPKAENGADASIDVLSTVKGAPTTFDIDRSEDAALDIPSEATKDALVSPDPLDPLDKDASVIGTPDSAVDSSVVVIVDASVPEIDATQADPFEALCDICLDDSECPSDEWKCASHGADDYCFPRVDRNIGTDTTRCDFIEPLDLLARCPGGVSCTYHVCAPTSGSCAEWEAKHQ